MYEVKVLQEILMLSLEVKNVIRLHGHIFIHSQAIMEL